MDGAVDSVREVRSQRPSPAVGLVVEPWAFPSLVPDRPCPSWAEAARQGPGRRDGQAHARSPAIIWHRAEQSGRGDGRGTDRGEKEEKRESGRE